MNKYTKTIRVLPYDQASRSAAALARELTHRIRMEEGDDTFAVKLVRKDPAQSTYKGNRHRKVINWGFGTLPPHVEGSRVINEPAAVNTVSNKKTFFENLEQFGDKAARVPAWTTSKREAKEWAKEERRAKYPFAFARTDLRGHSGAGIVELFEEKDVDRLKEGTLIVRYVPKKDEYRVHLSREGVFFVQKKVKRHDVDEPNYRIRSHENGFNFAQGDDYTGDCPVDVTTQAKLAFEQSGLDFGAVDVIYNRRLNEAYVLEINTAPGMEGQTTVRKYADALLPLLQKG